MNFDHTIKAFSTGDYFYAFTEYSAGFKRIRRLRAFTKDKFRIAVQENEIRLDLCLLWHDKSDQAEQCLISLTDRVCASRSYKHIEDYSYPVDMEQIKENRLFFRDKDRVVALQASLGLILIHLTKSDF